MSTRSQFSNAIQCPGCGHPGYARWEENAVVNRAGPQRTLALVSAGFRQDASRLQKSGDPTIICEECGSQVAD